MEFLIITGLSGAGKSRAADVLEDLDYYCVDNMPIALMPRFAELCIATAGRYEKVALVTDVREKDGFGQLLETIDQLKERGCNCRILYMDADVRTWPLDQLRRVVATVPQRASLVSGTIRSNLTWRDEAATDEELWAALDMAQASEFVRNKPQGLDAPVEAGGKNFSGGQRQRLTIARALVGSPQVLIMDDSASALDFKTDAALRHAIRERSVRGAAEGGLPLTTVIVSQRVSTVRDADMICVLDHGSVAGLGTHDELYATCQLYREICQSQLRREELEGQQGSTTPASAPTAPASVCAKEGC